ncbi:MAG: guanylate kinase [Pseudanabaena sp. RU_4_16]|nr:guanylate kinase [Pseudanabaena sp. RU_4_16]
MESQTDSTSKSQSSHSQKGKLVVVTGPSGVGKGTLLKILAERHPQRFVFSISATTRPPRPGEVDGNEYFFLTRPEFELRQSEGAFLEWAEYAGNLYGTPRQAVEAWISAGEVVLLEIELVGARQVAHTFPNAQKIFIAPPSIAVLEQRIRDRGMDNEAAIAKRLEHAQTEIDAAREFDLIVVNADLETAIEQLEQAIFS